MRRFTLSLPAVALGLVLAPNLASALTAVTTESTNLRAGPAFDFPIVDQIPPDVRVNVHGCVRGYRWCDVSWRDARGWVPGSELAYVYDGRRVTIVEYGPRIRVPVVIFSFDTYWDRYYRGRAWYGERARWRTVWRDGERGGRRAGDRDSDRESRSKDRTERRDVDRDARREADRGGSERRMDRRINREERPTGGSESGERGERGRGYNPPELRREMERGPRQGVDPGRGRAEPGIRSGPEGGRARDGRGREER